MARSKSTRITYGATFTWKQGGDAMKYNQLSKIWTPVFEGDGSGDEGGVVTQVEDTTVVADPNDATPPEGMVSQEKMNQVLAAEKKKHQKLVQKAIDEATAASKRAKLTAQERAELDNRLELIQNELRTKEEQAKRASEKARKAHNEEKKSLTADRDDWRKRYTDSTIERSITDAAATNNAFSPKQIVAILGPNTSLVPRLDGEGLPTQTLEPKVRFNSKDKDGKPVTLDLSPVDAVKRMKDEEEYLNLFRGEGAGGAGLRSQPGGKKTDVQQLAKDPAAYREARKKGQINFQ